MTLRCLEPYFASGKVAILDAGFASVQTAKALCEKGLHIIGNVKQMTAGFCREQLRAEIVERHAHSHRKRWVPKSQGNSDEGYYLYASGHRDRQPMFLVHSCGSS